MTILQVLTFLMRRRVGEVTSSDKIMRNIKTYNMIRGQDPDPTCCRSPGGGTFIEIPDVLRGEELYCTTCSGPTAQHVCQTIQATPQCLLYSPVTKCIVATENQPICTSGAYFHSLCKHGSKAAPGAVHQQKHNGKCGSPSRIQVCCYARVARGAYPSEWISLILARSPIVPPQQDHILITNFKASSFFLHTRQGFAEEQYTVLFSRSATRRSKFSRNLLVSLR
jgi:hypothetical protein